MTWPARQEPASAAPPKLVQASILQVNLSYAPSKCSLAHAAAKAAALEAILLTSWMCNVSPHAVCERCTSEAGGCSDELGT